LSRNESRVEYRSPSVRSAPPTHLPLSFRRRLSQRRAWPLAHSHREKIRGEHPWQEWPKQTRNSLSINSLIDQARKTTPTGGIFRGLQTHRGTASSNPLPSSGESVRTEGSPETAGIWTRSRRRSTSVRRIAGNFVGRHPNFLTSRQKLKSQVDAVIFLLTTC